MMRLFDKKSAGGSQANSSNALDMTPPVAINEPMLALTNITDKSAFIAQYERHFNYWVNGPTSRRDNTPIGRKAVNALWRCSDSALIMSVLGDDLEYFQKQTTHDDSFEEDEPHDYYRWFDLACVFGAQKIAEWVLEAKLNLSFNKLDTEMHSDLFANVAASGNEAWLTELVKRLELTKLPDSAFRMVNYTGMEMLERINTSLGVVALTLQTS
jgi:hypothetical protein